MSKTNALIFGHSHVWSIKKALLSGLFTPGTNEISWPVLLCGTSEFPDDVVLYDSSGKERLNPCLISALRHHSANDPAVMNILVSVVQGNYYNNVALVQEPGESFDFVVPGHEHLPLNDTVQAVPYTAISESIANAAKSFPSYIKRLSGLGYKRAFHIGAPPPPASNDLIIEEFRNRVDDVDHIEVVEPYVRQKLWIAQNAFMNAYCRKYGITYISAPEKAITEDGFLKPEYIKDSVHGNAKYSVLVLQKVEAEITGETA